MNTDRPNSVDVILHCLQNSKIDQPDKVKSTQSPQQASQAANPQFQPHHRAAAAAHPSLRLSAHGKAIQHEASAAELRQGHNAEEGHNAEAGGLVHQATALEEAAAMRDSAQDSDWLAMAQNIPDGKQMQARAAEEVWQALH